MKLDDLDLDGGETYRLDPTFVPDPPSVVRLGDRLRLRRVARKRWTVSSGRLPGGYVRIVESSTPWGAIRLWRRGR